MQILSISCFFADEALIAELFVSFFQAMNCKDKEAGLPHTSQFGNIAGISTGLPWIMTKINPDGDDWEELSITNGTLFPCPTKYADNAPWQVGSTTGPAVDKDKITDQINISIDVAIAFTIAFAVLQILSWFFFALFVVNMRSKLRAQGKASGNAFFDCLLGCCCWCCFLNQSLRESGVNGKSYSVSRSGLATLRIALT